MPVGELGIQSQGQPATSDPRLTTTNDYSLKHLRPHLGWGHEI